MGFAPSISAFIDGCPWPKGISTLPKPVEPNLKLDSFEDLGFKNIYSSNESSTTLELSQRTPTPSCDTHSEHRILEIPKYASITQGGWVDPSSWFFRLLWNKVKDFNLDELYNAYFTRDSRPMYGETHAMTRKPRPEAGLNKTVKPSNNKDKSKEAHGKQERERRERHRFLQREADNTIATFVFRWARDILGDVKKEAKTASCREANANNVVVNPQSHNHNHGRKVPRSSSSPPPPYPGQKPDKVAGKDDQLTAAVLTQYLASILICRQHEHIANQEDQLASQHDHIAKLEDKLASMSHLLQQEESICMRKPAPAHEWRSLKRAIHDAQQSMVISQQPLTSPHPMKRQRQCHLPKPAYPSRHGSIQHELLPPSPTPSRDGCRSYFCSK